MTTDNLIGKSKLTKVIKPLILPRHMAIKRSQELKKIQEESKKKGKYSAKKDVEKLDLFFHYFNNFPDFYKWLVVGIFGAIYGLKPGMDLIRSNKK